MEINENTGLFIPQRLADIKVGDVVRFRSEDAIRSDYRAGKIDLGWCDSMYSLCGQEHVISERDMARIIAQTMPIWVVKVNNSYKGISLSMLEFANEAVPEKDSTSIRIKDKDEGIIKEMIKKVDLIRFKKLLTIACDHKQFKFGDINSTIVDRYLRDWAIAKYEYYLMFGKSLSISVDIEMDMDERDMQNKVSDLCCEYPLFSNLLNGFHTREFLDNKCMGYNHILERYYPEYKRDSKLSKVLSKLIADKTFNDDIANLLQNRKVKARLAVSIDPYDYLTMSVNNYGWDSCQAIGSGGYATGAGSIMLDESTLIAYKYNGNNQNYNIHNLRFEGNSKSWRQCLYFDKDTSNFVSSRQYPSQSDLITKEIRGLLEGYVCGYLNKENNWVVTTNGDIQYKEGSSCLYHDLLNGHTNKVAYLKGASRDTTVVVGANIYCPSCGEKITRAKNTFLCGKCYDDLGEAHEEEEDIPFDDEDDEEGGF